jgi:hypothetical protein
MRRALGAAGKGVGLFTHCLFCERPFSETEAFESFASGRRIAWDPARVRLWAICDHCHRWNLCPIEDRHETIEALERLARDRGHLVAQTANIALLHAEPFVLLRVGRAELAEEAWWRYGKELRRRRASFYSRGSRLSAYSFAALASVSESIGLTDTGIKIAWDETPIADVLRWRHFSWAAWQGRVPCPSCTSVLLAVRFDLSWWLYPLRAADGSLAVGVPCDRCDPWTPDKVYRIEGADAEYLLRRVLAYQQISGATDEMLGQAMDALRSAGSATGFVNALPDRRSSLWRLGPTRRLALEIAINERAERRALDAEVRALESRWVEEEEIARIVDEELTAFPSASARLIEPA